MEDLSPLSKSLEAGAPAEPREEHDDEPSSNAEEGEKNGDQDVVMTEVSAVVPKKRGRSPSPSPSPGRTDSTFPLAASHILFQGLFILLWMYN